MKICWRWNPAGHRLHSSTLTLTQTPQASYRLLGSGPVLGSAQQPPGIVRKMFTDTWAGQDGLWLNLGVHCNLLAAGSSANLMTPVSISYMFQSWLQMSQLKVCFFCGHQPVNDSIPHYLLNCPLKTDNKTDRLTSSYKRASVICVYSHPTTSTSCDM